jgi:hypothetical protein
VISSLFFQKARPLFSKHLNAMNDSISSSNAGINFPFSNFPFLSGGMPMLYDVIAKPKSDASSIYQG